MLFFKDWRLFLSSGLAKIKSVCFNFVQFERAFDLLVPDSRVQGEHAERYLKTNRAASPLLLTEEQWFDAIMACDSIAALQVVMNGGSGHDFRYYELNLQVMETYNTLEFRMHSSTTELEKTLNWIRLILAFVKVSGEEKAVVRSLEESLRLKD